MLTRAAVSFLSWIAVGGLLVFACAGCMGGMRWSGPAPRGHGRIGIGSDYAFGQTPDRDYPERGDLFVEYRRGLTDRWDLGGRAHVLGGSLDARHLLTRARYVETGIGVGVRAGAIPENAELRGAEYAFEPAFRLGLDVSPRVQIGVGVVPGLGYRRDTREGAVMTFTKRGFVFTPELALALDLGVSDGFHIVPMVAANTYVGVDSFEITDDTVRVRTGVGFYF